MEGRRRDEMLHALQQWGVPFLSGARASEAPSPLTSCELIQSLIESDSERLKLAVTAFFLIRPERAADVHAVLPHLDQRGSTLLKYYYMAAAYLQVLWQTALMSPKQMLLPDYFSEALGLPPPTIPQSHMGLVALEEKFQEAVGWPYNYRSSFDALVRLLGTERMHDW